MIRREAIVFENKFYFGDNNAFTIEKPPLDGDSSGSALNIKGQYSSGAKGGDLILEGGTGGVLEGGDVMITAGEGQTNGGDIVFKSGDGSDNNGGTFTIHSGTGISGNGGFVELQAGAGEGSAGTGGDLTIRSGKGDGIGGNMLIQVGESEGGAGALLEIKGSKGSTDGGYVQFSTGDWGDSNEPGKFKFIDGKNNFIMSEFYRQKITDKIDETRLKYNYATRYLLKSNEKKSFSIGDHGELASGSSLATYLTFDTDTTNVEDSRKVILGDSLESGGNGLVDILDINMHVLDARSQITTIEMKHDQNVAFKFVDTVFESLNVDNTMARGKREGMKHICLSKQIMQILHPVESMWINFSDFLILVFKRNRKS